MPESFAEAAMTFVELFGRKGDAADMVVAENNCVAIAESPKRLRSHENIDDDPAQYQTQVNKAHEAYVTSKGKGRRHYLFALDTPVESGGVPTFVQTDFGFKIEQVLDAEFTDLARRGKLFISKEYAEADGASPVIVKQPHATAFIAPVIPQGVRTTVPPSDGIEIQRVR